MANTVILGSGIIGLSTAYYLLEHQPGSTIHLVESSPTLFASASGFAGGFLARDWFQPSVASLGALSYREHESVAEKEGGCEKWGYAKSVTVSYQPGTKPAHGKDEDWLSAGSSRADAVDERREKYHDGEIPPWLRRSSGDAIEVLDGDGGTAIVYGLFKFAVNSNNMLTIDRDPLKLCKFLLDKCQAAGVHLHHPATALSVGIDVRGELSTVRIGHTDSSTESEIPATRLLLSAGAWTPSVFAFLFKDAPVNIPISSHAGHSLAVRNPSHVEDRCHAVYCSMDALSPELYSRPSGVIYLAGVNSGAIPLPSHATGAQPVETSVDELKGIASRLIASDGELEVVRTGLCFRPVTRRGTPFIARLEDGQLGDGVSTRPGAEGGVFLAAGHGPWGISLSLGTGRVVAEMMQGRELSADVSLLGL